MMRVLSIVLVVLLASPALGRHILADAPAGDVKKMGDTHSGSAAGVVKTGSSSKGKEAKLGEYQLPPGLEGFQWSLSRASCISIPRLITVSTSGPSEAQQLMLLWHQSSTTTHHHQCTHSLLGSLCSHVIEISVHSLSFFESDCACACTLLLQVALTPM